MTPLDHIVCQLQEQQRWEKTKILRRNEFLCRSGITDTNLYFIVRGSLRIFVMDTDEEQTIRFGYQGNILSVLDSYLTGQPTDFWIQALKETEVKIISKASFKRFIEQDPELLQCWKDILELLIYTQMQRERDILTTSPHERYQRVLKRSPQLFQEIPDKYIASYLRMSPETLSRIKKS